MIEGRHLNFAIINEHGGPTKLRIGKVESVVTRDGHHEVAVRGKTTKIPSTSKVTVFIEEEGVRGAYVLEPVSLDARGNIVHADVTSESTSNRETR